MCAWSIDVPGEPSDVSFARHWAGRILYNTPAADDIQLVISELATNAVRHTASGEKGGRIHIEMDIRQDIARIAVVDDGPAEDPSDAWTEEESEAFGRGLMIVNSLADRWGDEQIATGHRVWAEIKLTHPSLPRASPASR